MQITLTTPTPIATHPYLKSTTTQQNNSKPITRFDLLHGTVEKE